MHPRTKAKQAYTKSYKWIALSKRLRKQNPLCYRCLLIDKITPSAVVDHIIPFDADPYGVLDKYAYDTDNLRCLCKSCHTVVTRFEYSIYDAMIELLNKTGSYEDVAVFKYSKGLAKEIGLDGYPIQHKATESVIKRVNDSECPWI